MSLIVSRIFGGVSEQNRIGINVRVNDWIAEREIIASNIFNNTSYKSAHVLHTAVM